MKKLSVLSMMAGFLFCWGAMAADITMYYSPSCPHCHHAREFFVNKMVYEYPDLRIVQVNVMDKANLPAFKEVLEKCGYESGGVPVIVVGDKCFQGYADFMQQELRDAVEVDYTDSERKAVAETRKEFDADPDGFCAKHSERKRAIEEYGADNSTASYNDAVEKKNRNYDAASYFYVLLIAAIAFIGVMLIRKDRSKK